MRRRCVAAALATLERLADSAGGRRRRRAGRSGRARARACGPIGGDAVAERTEAFDPLAALEADATGRADRARGPPAGLSRPTPPGSRGPVARADRRVEVGRLAVDEDVDVRPEARPASTSRSRMPGHARVERRRGPRRPSRRVDVVAPLDAREQRQQRARAAGRSPWRTRAGSVEDDGLDRPDLRQVGGDQPPRLALVRRCATAGRSWCRT